MGIDFKDTLFKNISFDIDKKLTINDKKRINSSISEARKKAKSDKCLICGKEATSFCNSHTIPQFILRNIYGGGKFKGSFFGKTTEKGLNQAEVFHCVCEECDRTIFKDYENPNNYNNGIITQTMMAEIALKISLQMLYKRFNEKALYSKLNEEHPLRLIEHNLLLGDLDVEDFINYKDYAIKYLNNKSECGYILQYYRKLDYITPYAFQGLMGVVCDLEGNIINDTYNFDQYYHIQFLNICVFPFKDYSLVFCFTRKRDTRYNRFFKQFNKLTEDDKLALVNYLIFRYNENIVISDLASKEIINDASLKEISLKSDIYFKFPWITTKDLCKNKEGYKIDYQSVTNLLSQKYKIDR